MLRRDGVQIGVDKTRAVTNDEASVVGGHNHTFDIVNGTNLGNVRNVVHDVGVAGLGDGHFLGDGLVVVVCIGQYHGSRAFSGGIIGCAGERNSFTNRAKGEPVAFCGSCQRANRIRLVVDGVFNQAVCGIVSDFNIFSGNARRNHTTSHFLVEGDFGTEVSISVTTPILITVDAQITSGFIVFG